MANSSNSDNEVAILKEQIKENELKMGMLNIQVEELTQQLQRNEIMHKLPDFSRIKMEELVKLEEFYHCALKEVGLAKVKIFFFFSLFLFF